MPSPLRHRAIAGFIAGSSFLSIAAPWLPKDSLPTLAGAPSIRWLTIPAVAGLSIAWISLIYRVICMFLAAPTGGKKLWTEQDRFGGFFFYGLLEIWRRQERRDHVSQRSSPPTRAAIEISPGTLAFLAVLTSFAGTLAIDGIVQLLLQRNIVPPVPLDIQTIVGAIIVLAIGFPIAETLVMAVTLEAARKRRFRIQALGLASGVLWGIIHATLNHWLQFPSMFWMFWVLSILYLQVRKDGGLGQSIAITCLAHILNNLLAISAIVVRQQLG